MKYVCARVRVRVCMYVYVCVHACTLQLGGCGGDRKIDKAAATADALILALV